MVLSLGKICLAKYYLNYNSKYDD